MKRGNALEARVSAYHRKQIKEKKSLILKLATPIELTNSGLITHQSTVDFYGVVTGGKFFAMDAKETKVKTRFDLKNIHQHQLDYLDRVRALGGYGFLLIHFTSVHTDSAFLVTPQFIKEAQDRGAKSIKLDEFPSDKLVPIDEYLDYIYD